MEVNEAIDKRYSDLAVKSCCLSCGGALNHAKPQPSEICCDLGSGRGNDVLRMAEEVGEDGFAYGVDISSGMLDKARRQARRLNLSNVEFREGTLEKLPLGDNTIDVLISNCTINHATDKVAVWSEVFRILKPGGRFVVSDIYSSERVPEEFATDPRAISECWGGAVEKEVYMDTLFNTGFTELAILEESEPYPKGQIEVSSFTVFGRKPA